MNSNEFFVPLWLHKYQRALPDRKVRGLQPCGFAPRSSNHGEWGQWCDVEALAISAATRRDGAAHATGRHGRCKLITHDHAAADTI
jgi:hypothetical protein